MWKVSVLHVSAPECHPQGVDKGITIQHTNLGNDRPHLYHYNIKILEYTKVTSINLQYCDIKTKDQINLSGCFCT